MDNTPSLSHSEKTFINALGRATQLQQIEWNYCSDEYTLRLSGSVFTIKKAGDGLIVFTGSVKLLPPSRYYSGFTITGCDGLLLQLFDIVEFNSQLLMEKALQAIINNDLVGVEDGN